MSSLVQRLNVTVGGAEWFEIDLANFRAVQRLQDHPCRCEELRESQEQVIGLIIGTIDGEVERSGAVKVRVPIHVYAVKTVDGSYICIAPDCFCKALIVASKDPKLASRVLVNMTLIDRNKYDLDNDDARNALRAIAAKYCAGMERRPEVLTVLIHDVLVLLGKRSGELREIILDWLSPGDPEPVPKPVPNRLREEVARLLRISSGSADRYLKHIFLNIRNEVLRELGIEEERPREGQTMTELVETVPRETKVVGVGAEEPVREGVPRKEEDGCHEPSKSALVYEVLGRLGIPVDGEHTKIKIRLCNELSKNELHGLLELIRKTPDKHDIVKEMLLNLNIDYVKHLLTKPQTPEAESGEAGVEYAPPEVEASRAGEKLVRAARAYRDALERVKEADPREGSRAMERVKDAETGVSDSYTRVVEAFFRTLFSNDKKAHELAMKYTELFRFTLPNPYIVVDLAELVKSLGDAGKLVRIIDTVKHIETRCSGLGVNCGNLWDAVRRAMEDVVEAVERAREYQDVVSNNGKIARNDELAAAMRAAAEEIASEVCSAIDVLRDLMLDIIYNATSDKNLANTARELLGKAVVTRCGAF